MKLLKTLFSVTMVVFALLQWNDPDGLLWMVIYGYAGLMAALSLTSFRLRPYILVGIAGLVLAIVFYLPDFISWIAGGMPSITGSMHAESPFIELVREFLGLIIALLVMFFLLYAERSGRSKYKS